MIEASIDTITISADIGKGYPVKGDPGDNGYVHIAYANSTDGKDFTLTPESGKTYEYLGQYTDNTETASTEWSDYKWSWLTDEASRQAAETARTAAETARATAEESRVNAEKTRTTGESERVEAESKRANAESARAAAEETRVANEDGRTDDEARRRDAENRRESTERAREANETERVNAETARVNAETDRANAETKRQAAESERVSAESARVEADAKRQTINDEQVQKVETAATNAAASETAAGASATNAKESETFVAENIDTIAKEPTAQEILTVLNDSLVLLKKIAEEGTGGGSLNGFSFSLGTNGELIISYTNPADKEDTATATMATQTTAAKLLTQMDEMIVSMRKMAGKDDA